MTVNVWRVCKASTNIRLVLLFVWSVRQANIMKKLELCQKTFAFRAHQTVTHWQALPVARATKGTQGRMVGHVKHAQQASIRIRQGLLLVRIAWQELIIPTLELHNQAFALSVQTTLPHRRAAKQKATVCVRQDTLTKAFVGTTHVSLQMMESVTKKDMM